VICCTFYVVIVSICIL